MDMSRRKGRDYRYTEGGGLQRSRWNAQVVARGELFAIVIIINRAQIQAHIHVVTGCWPVHQGVAKQQRAGADKDLWRHLWNLVSSKHITLDATLIKPHLARFPHLIDEYVSLVRALLAVLQPMPWLGGWIEGGVTLGRGVIHIAFPGYSA